MVDYFAEREKDKQERRSKNELQRLRNIKRSRRFSDEVIGNKPLGITVEFNDRDKHQVLNYF